MASDFWDVGQWKETATGKKFFVKLGSAKQKKDGGFYVELDALPLQRADDKGVVRCSLVINAPRERDGGGYSAGVRTDESRDEIPF